MRGPLKEGTAWAAALAAALPAFLIPLYNPDLFWHLSAGRWMVEHAALPRTEFLSFSLPGQAWLDFEWLSQLLLQGAYAAGGMAALWLLKAALVAACAWAFDGALRANRVGGWARPAALAAWAAAAVAWSDARPELFSVLFFTLLLWQLERLRLDEREPDLKAAAQTAALFALWANLHAGFPVGALLIGIYAVGELIVGRPRRAFRTALLALVAAAAALANPYGAGPYRVAYEHFRDRALLAKAILEWHPMSATNPVHWPFYGLVAAALSAMATRLAEPYHGAALWRRRLPWALILATGHFGANALMHARMAAFFGVTAALLLGVVGDEARAWARRTLAAAAAAALIFSLWLSPRIYRASFFNPKFVPVAAAEFMARQEPALAPLRLFNQWEWGGYLAWRLRPWLRVFADGRYIFHPLLEEQLRATESPENWSKFLAEHRLNGALVPNRDAMLPSVRRYPDGSEKAIERPWYVAFFPRERWALVYWDPTALLFVERSAVPAAWLSAHEYRWLRPRDEAAFADADARGEIPREALAAERKRHDGEAAIR